MTAMHSWFAAFLRASARPILWMSTVLHYIWAIGLVLIPERVAGTTGLWPYSKAPEAFGLIMFSSATLALVTLIRDMRGLPPTALTFWSFIPQQAFLSVTAGACLYFAAQGQFADGTVVAGAGWFIFYDQVSKVLLALFHPAGVFRMHLPIFPAHRSLTRVAGDGADG